WGARSNVASNRRGRAGRGVCRAEKDRVFVADPPRVWRFASKARRSAHRIRARRSRPGRGPWNCAHPRQRQDRPQIEFAIWGLGAHTSNAIVLGDQDGPFVFYAKLESGKQLNTDRNKIG